MKPPKQALAIAGLMLFSLASAHASELDLTITEKSGSDISGTLDFTLGGSSSPYSITAVTGTISGAGFSEAVTGANGYAGAGLGGDVIYSPPTFADWSYVNNFGVSLSLANGTSINISPADPSGPSDPYYNVFAVSDPADSSIYDQEFTLGPSVSSTPLPAALPLFAGGLGIVGLLARRKKRKAEGQLTVA
jgi:hypothetical protein